MTKMPIYADLATLSPQDLRLTTLISIRWGAVGGQAAALLAVHFGLGYPLPLVEAFATVAALAVVNIVLTATRPAQERLGQKAAAIQLAFDLIQLTVLLYYTGGLVNPFAFLLLAPLTIAATLLCGRCVIVLCCIAMAGVTALAVWHMPLPWEGGGGLPLPPIYLLGGWVALAVGITFFSAL